MVRLTPRIVAIFLIEKTSSGSNFVFQWPPQPQVHFQDSHKSSEDVSIAMDILKIEDDDSQEFNGAADENHVLGYEKGFLANMLSPRPELCNQKFEMWVDGLTFLGCPVHVGPSGEWVKRKNPSKNVDDSSLIDPSGLKEDSTNSASANTPESKPNQYKSTSSMSLFHVVFVLNIPTASIYRPTINTLYESIVVKLVTGLKYEQAKRNYVENECKNIRKMTERYSNKKTPFDDFCQEIPVHSNLASILVTTYEALIHLHTAYLEINQSINITLLWPMTVSVSSLDKLELQERSPTILASQTIFNEEEPSLIEPFVAPYWSLLLLQDLESIMKRLPLSRNSLLASFITEARPTSTFTDIANSLGISLSECFLLAKHLIHWRKAIAIPPLLIRNTYVTSPTADLSKLKSDAGLFKRTFPSLPSLPTFLAILSFKPRPFGSIIPSKDHESTYMEMLAWLCRRNWVYEQNSYIYVCVTPQIKKKVKGDIESQSSEDQDSQLLEQLRHDDGRESLIIDPHSASLLEQKWIQAIAFEKSTELASLFLSVVKYFNGRYALQTIWIAEGLPRKSMRNVLNEYQHYLIRWFSW
ncbi:GATOR1-SEACIT GTPase complex subunit Npr3 [Schizosaccharomyces osmophilus]|uniref:Nitrogen permease regulator 3 n=1 Tax=Schizosaccharomyces osmophilus TaxID=2545709 RepID=A0AAE9WDJ5_9SCHI|nr:GATOR1-SEACIT GTPase complex subunit Npr3 [Schizosaccharomyces osmophilus]WBW73945.1 GATOR1-SEACIT GTPase complex subunit Npr3 [Schizosaccharomyces osmophilus]